jgi:hypothetical protein
MVWLIFLKLPNVDFSDSIQRRSEFQKLNFLNRSYFKVTTVFNGFPIPFSVPVPNQTPPVRLAKTPPIAPSQSDFLLTNLCSLNIRARIPEVLCITQKLRPISHQHSFFPSREKLTFHPDNSRYNPVPRILREVGGRSMGRGCRLRSNRRGCWVLEVMPRGKEKQNLRAIRAMGGAVWFLADSACSCFGCHKDCEETCCKETCELHVSEFRRLMLWL